MRILLIVPRYAITGVPLAQLKLAQVLATRRHDVTLIFTYCEPIYDLPNVDNIKIICWNVPKVRNTFSNIFCYLKSHKPDIVFSAEDHLNVIVLLAAIVSGSSSKISCSSRVTPYDTYSTKIFSKRWFLKIFAKIVNYRADALTCVSKDMVLQYKYVLGSTRHICIHNIVYDTISQFAMSELVTHPWFKDRRFPIIIAAGRLAPWKGFSTLIEAISILHKRRPVRLLILGDGPQKSELKNMVDDYALSDYVEFAGYVTNPLKYFKKSDVFVLSSLVEGMPNVLVEAMMCGCTPVSTNCPTGPSELLQNGKYGYLIPIQNPAAMADAIEHALEFPISKHLLKEAILPFHEDRVIQQHFESLGLCEKSYT